jgi:hypothetical protein
MMSTALRGLRRAPASILLVATAIGAGCDKPRAIGDVNEILVAAPQPVWASLEDGIKEVLEPRTFSFREERVFEVAYIDPSQPRWNDLRFQRQVLVIGSPAESPVAEAMQEVRGEVPAAPAIVQARNVWAQNQLVTVLLLPENASPSVAEPLLPELGSVYLRQFEEYARSRMFATRPNEELADSLRANAGFSLTLPQVYRHEMPEPGVFLFRNDQPDPSRLIRNITVASRPAGEVEVTEETTSAWRADLASRLTHPPQVTETLPETRQIEIGGLSALQIQGLWSNPPGEWPAAGHFITRVVTCADRVFLIDGWLYAPGLSKYEYMFQLTTILDSFECA